MPDSTPRVAANFRIDTVKVGGLRISDAESASSTAYVELLTGTGVPSGGYGRDASATLFYLRQDAPTRAHAIYESIDGGTTWKAKGGVLYASTAASTAITGATETETVFDTNYTLPADSCAAGTVYRIRGQGIHTATTGAETHSILVKFGSVTLVTKATIDPANNEIFHFECLVVIRTIGASGTLVGSGTLGVGASGTGTTAINYLGSTAIDTTVANLIGAFIDRQTTATDGDSARLDVLVIEML